MVEDGISGYYTKGQSPECSSAVLFGGRVRRFFGGELATPSCRHVLVDRARIELATHGFSGRASWNFC